MKRKESKNPSFHSTQWMPGEPEKGSRKVTKAEHDRLCNAFSEAGFEGLSKELRRM